MTAVNAKTAHSAANREHARTRFRCSVSVISMPTIQANCLPRWGTPTGAGEPLWGWVVLAHFLNNKVLVV